MEITLNTSRQCIETASKKEYERLIQQYFKTDSSEKNKILMEEQIEALTYFLQNADFSYLRNRYHAMGFSGTSVLAIPETLKNMHIRLAREILCPVWKKR